VAKGVRRRTVFDKMSRDTLTMTIGPQVTLPNSRVVPVDTVRVRSTYDAEGNRLRLTEYGLRTASHDKTGSARRRIRTLQRTTTHFHRGQSSTRLRSDQSAS